MAHTAPLGARGVAVDPGEGSALYDPLTVGRALITDLYELNMAASYLRRGMVGPATFSLFVRKLPMDRGFVVSAGLEDCLSYLEAFAFDDEDRGRRTPSSPACLVGRRRLSGRCRGRIRRPALRRRRECHPRGPGRTAERATAGAWLGRRASIPLGPGYRATSRHCHLRPDSCAGRWSLACACPPRSQTCSMR